MASQLEQELTCSICSDIFRRPVALLDCLHTFCKACVNSWFDAQSDNGSPEFTCPICREEVKSLRRDTRAANLAEWFLLKREADETSRPSDEVLADSAPLAAGTLRSAEEEGQGEGRGSASSSDTFTQEEILGEIENSRPSEYDRRQSTTDFYNLDDHDGSGEEQEEREMIDFVTAMSLSTYDQETNARRMGLVCTCNTRQNGTYKTRTTRRTD